MKRRAFLAVGLAAIIGAAVWASFPWAKRLPLLPQRPHLGAMKPLASARTSQSRLANGQLLLTIDHDTIRGVTPSMLRWWFEHLGETMVHEGVSYPRYLLWHPRDHIHFELAKRSPSGGTGQGAYFRIVEAFAANPDFYVDSTEYVEKLDDEGISLVKRIFGREVFRLEHRYRNTAGGASYRSRMVVGADAKGPMGRLFNDHIRPRIFSNEAATAWLTHNVEEVGMFEHVLPRLYARGSKNAPDPSIELPTMSSVSPLR
jgi:hypothetical protein